MLIWSNLYSYTIPTKIHSDFSLEPDFVSLLLRSFGKANKNNKEHHNKEEQWGSEGRKLAMTLLEHVMKTLELSLQYINCHRTMKHIRKSRNGPNCTYKINIQ